MKCDAERRILACIFGMGKMGKRSCMKTLDCSKSRKYRTWTQGYCYRNLLQRNFSLLGSKRNVTLFFPLSAVHSRDGQNQILHMTVLILHLDWFFSCIWTRSEIIKLLNGIGSAKIAAARIAEYFVQTFQAKWNYSEYLSQNITAFFLNFF